MPRPAVFLDRDDTLIRCRDVAPSGDLGDPALVSLVPGADAACERLKGAGFALVVVSNQGGVARGRYTEADVDAVNAELNRQLGAAIDRFYYCPFHPGGTVPAYTREHPWRKPQPGMILAAAADLGLDLTASWVVGDQPRDCVAGRAAACRTILVGTQPADAAAVDFTAPSLLAAADIILARSDRP